MNLSDYSQDWFSALSSISTSFGAVASFLLLLVTFLYLLATRKMVNEMSLQRISQEDPAVSVRIVPDTNNFGMMNICVKNTGGGPAYNLSVNFEPDLPYHSSTVNELKMFKDMPLIDRSETIEFLFDSANNYFNSDGPKITTAVLTYYKKPLIDNEKDNKPIIRKIRIDIEERKGLLHVNQNSIHDLVKEVEELKQGVLILLSEKKARSRE